MKSIFMKYRQGLIEFGKKVAFENPDKLSQDELIALTARVFNELNKLDMSIGYPEHQIPIILPDDITKERQEELFFDFLDWYEILEMPSSLIYNYVIKNYSNKKYPKILCVGDGENCHLGRKLCMAGYNVVSVDPFARKEFSTKKDNNLKPGEGSLHVVKGTFEKNSSDMIDWANVIVGSKIPLCAESIIDQGKPAIFNISDNVEIYNMRFKGKIIKSSSDLIDEMKKCPNVRVQIETSESLRECNYIFVCNDRQRDNIGR